MAEKIEEFIVPIIAASLAQKPRPLRLLGTAFFIGNARTFLTAWHVIDREIKSAKERGEEVFLLSNSEKLRILSILDIRRANHNADTAVGTVNQDVKSTLSLCNERISFGRDVCAIGYPAHLFQNSPDLKQFKAPLKFMKRHIYTDIWHTDVWPYDYLDHAAGPVDFLELSFPIPQGVSGSPLILLGTHTVVGVCVGTTKGLQFDSVVEHEEGKQTTIYDVERIGIAHMSNIVADCTFPWLNGIKLKELKT